MKFAKLILKSFFSANAFIKGWKRKNRVTHKVALALSRIVYVEGSDEEIYVRCVGHSLSNYPYALVESIQTGERIWVREENIFPVMQNN